MSDRGLKVIDLKVGYGPARVVESLSASVRPGEVVGLAGPNGAGKTTTLRAISGLLKRQRGQILINGEELPARPDVIARAGIAHVPEGRGLVPSLTVRQNLRLAAVAVGRPFSGEALDSVLATFPAIERLLDRRAGLLSGGEQQMTAIGRGLIVSPTVLMVDELSLGLAPKIVENLLLALRQIAETKQVGIFLVDQNVRGLWKICDRILLLEEGVCRQVEKNDQHIIESIYVGHGRKKMREGDVSPALD